ncbi:MAG TPA: type II toxin-antitoxin system RelE/ParE family toxin [Plantibacter sp.]|uniref:type II toxin-antitoxin system RelE family toxin n=1 Tax=unclassified Plantibacter TaxID=2624265 RepID=UPI002CF3BC6F|nr:type II toxin-antitoxin system RelE/ParE family toxin [Plantibacter sp.]
MTPYVVEFTTAAAREIRKLDPQLRRRILAGIEDLGVDPRPNGVRKLAGLDNAWRIRIGDYRVLSEIVDEVVLVTVFRIAYRREVSDR